MDFLTRRRNRRTDAYGGSLENRVRLLRELLEDTREAVGDSMAVALRFATEELLGDEGVTWEDEGCKVIEMLADCRTCGMSMSATGRMTQRRRVSARKGFQEPYVAFVRAW